MGAEVRVTDVDGKTFACNLPPALLRKLREACVPHDEGRQLRGTAAPDVMLPLQIAPANGASGQVSRRCLYAWSPP